MVTLHPACLNCHVTISLSHTGKNPEKICIFSKILRKIMYFSQNEQFFSKHGRIIRIAPYVGTYTKSSIKYIKDLFFRKYVP